MQVGRTPPELLADVDREGELRQLAFDGIEPVVLERAGQGVGDHLPGVALIADELECPGEHMRAAIVSHELDVAHETRRMLEADGLREIASPSRSRDDRRSRRGGKT